MAEVQGPAFSALFGSELWADVQAEPFPTILAGVTLDSVSGAGALAGLQLQLPAKVALRAWCNMSIWSHNQKLSVCFYVKTDVGFFVCFLLF